MISDNLRRIASQVLFGGFLMPLGTVYEKDSAVVRLKSMSLKITASSDDNYDILIDRGDSGSKSVPMSKEGLDRFLKATRSDPDRIERFIAGKKCACSQE